MKKIIIPEKRDFIDAYSLSGDELIVCKKDNKIIGFVIRDIRDKEYFISSNCNATAIFNGESTYYKYLIDLILDGIKYGREFYIVDENTQISNRDCAC